jgi:hypothetical protein
VTRKTSIIVVLIGIAVLLVVALFFEREPRWQSKSLSYWAFQYGSNNWSAGHGSVAHREAEKAILGIGTNGIPFLVNQLRATDSKIMRTVRSHLPKKWRNNYPFRDNSAETRRCGAYGLAALGTNAASAVPELIKTATNHKEEDGRYIAVFALRTLGPAGEPAMPFLISCLTNAIDSIRDEAAIGLGDIGRHPAVVLPALIQFVKERAVSHPNNYEVPDAINAISKYASDARVAGPLLTTLLSHSNANVREAATNCIARVGLVPKVEQESNVPQ